MNGARRPVRVSSIGHQGSSARTCLVETNAIVSIKSAVIASEAKQSQPRTHEQVKRDCFAEFILGLAGGETRGPAMTRGEFWNHAAYPKPCHRGGPPDVAV